MLWENKVQTPDFMGRVVGDTAVLVSPAEGVLAGLQVLDFDDLEAGETLGSVVVAKPDVFQAQLEYIRSGIDYLKISREPTTNLNRNYLNYTGLQLDLMNKRVDLAGLRIQFNQADREYERAQLLFERDLLEDETYERIQTEHTLLQNQIEETQNLIDSLTLNLENMAQSTDVKNVGDDDVIESAIRVKEAELMLVESEMRSTPIKSPISGVVQNQHRFNGDFVSPGDTVAVIGTPKPKYIIGYLRQPFSIDPEVGMEVEVRSRKASRNKYVSRIIELGGQIIPIAPDLQRPGAIYESGLPVKVAIDEVTEFYPGEIVDLILRP